MKKFLSRLSERDQKRVLQETEKGKAFSCGREALLVVSPKRFVTDLTVFQVEGSSLVRTAFRKPTAASSDSLRGLLEFFEFVAEDPFQLFLVGSFGYDEFVSEFLLKERGRLLSTAFRSSDVSYVEAVFNRSALSFTVMSFRPKRVRFFSQLKDFPTTLLEDQMLLNRVLERLLSVREIESLSRESLLQTFREEAIKAVSQKRKKGLVF